MEENICEGCKFDKIVDNKKEFDEILENCTNCCRGHIEGSIQHETFDDKYVTE